MKSKISGIVCWSLLSVPLLCGAGQAQTHGEVTSGPCPYSCRTQGIPKAACKDWRQGNTCFVENLTKVQKSSPQQNSPQPLNRPWGTDPQAQGQPAAGNKECRRASGEYIARPRINIYRVRKTGGFFGSKFRVQGDYEGICLIEAGYFESGRKQQNFQIRTSRDFQRFQFEVTIQADREPELRVYNVNGDSDVVFVDPNQFPD